MTSFHVLCLLASLISPAFSLVPLQPFTDSLAALQAACLAWGTLLCFGYFFPQLFSSLHSDPCLSVPQRGLPLDPQASVFPLRSTVKAHTWYQKCAVVSVLLHEWLHITRMWTPSTGTVLICHAISSPDCWCGAGTLLGWKWMVLDLVSLLPWKTPSLSIGPHWTLQQAQAGKHSLVK